MIFRRGVGSAIDAAQPVTGSAAGAASAAGATYGPSLGQLGATPDSWFAANVDTPLSCSDLLAAGADVSGTSCASPLSSLPSWAIPAGVGVVAFLLLMIGGRR